MRVIKREESWSQKDNLNGEDVRGKKPLYTKKLSLKRK